MCVCGGVHAHAHSWYTAHSYVQSHNTTCLIRAALPPCPQIQPDRTQHKSAQSGGPTEHAATQLTTTMRPQAGPQHHTGWHTAQLHNTTQLAITTLPSTQCSVHNHIAEHTQLCSPQHGPALHRSKATHSYATTQCCTTEQNPMSKLHAMTDDCPTTRACYTTRSLARTGGW